MVSFVWLGLFFCFDLIDQDFVVRLSGVSLLELREQRLFQISMTVMRVVLMVLMLTTVLAAALSSPHPDAPPPFGKHDPGTRQAPTLFRPAGTSDEHFLSRVSRARKVLAHDIAHPRMSYVNALETL